MDRNEGMERIDPSSSTYQEVARLYRTAQDMHPGGQDRWNGELYARFDDKWGSLGRDGTLRLNQDLVLRNLTGGSLSDDPSMQAQALATVLHESRHARAEFDAPAEPNALRRPESVGLDEGLTEVSTMQDFAEFAQRAGYDEVPQPAPEYPGAVHAADALLDRATTSEAERTELLNRLVDTPVMMRWDTIADSVVHNELADAVPPDAAHQQSARAHLVNQMAVPEWQDVHNRPAAGPMVADLTNDRLNQATNDLRTHYGVTPETPFPARTPNPHAELTAPTDRSTDQARAISPAARAETVDLSRFPPPAAESRVTTAAERANPNQQPTAAVAAQSTGSTAPEMRFLEGQAPAAAATHRTPNLGDGARGAGSPTVPTHARQRPQTTGRGE